MFSEIDVKLCLSYFKVFLKVYLSFIWYIKSWNFVKKLYVVRVWLYERGDYLLYYEISVFCNFEIVKLW